MLKIDNFIRLYDEILPSFFNAKKENTFNSLEHKEKDSSGSNNQINRDQWVESKLKMLSNGLLILDAGAGQKRYKKYCSHLTYKSQDFCQYNGFGDNTGLQNSSWEQNEIDIISDVVSIPETDSKYDAILCTEVIEHIPKPIDAVKEFYRLLKPGGTLILTAPLCSLTHMAPYHFYSGFNRYFYISILSEIGFEIMEISSNGNYFDYICQELMRFPDILSKYCESMDITDEEKRSLSCVSRLLNKCSEMDNGSDDLVCFGYHILAKKNDNR